MELTINIGNLVWRCGFEKSCELYKNAGFTAMDLSVCSMTRDDSPYHTPEYRAVAENYRRMAYEGGLPIVQTHTPFGFSPKQWNDPAYFEEVIFPRLVRSLEISAIFGAKTAVVHPLHYITYRGHEEELFEANMAFYRRLLPYCKEYNIKCAIENMWQNDPRRGYIVAATCSCAEEFIRYIDTLDSEYMVACLDVGHVVLPLGDEEPQDVIRKLGHDRLQALHIHDNDYKSDQHYLPYFGKLNWMEIARALGEIDYQGDFTYEVGPEIIINCDEAFLPIMTNFMGDVGKHITAEVERCRIKK